MIQNLELPQLPGDWLDVSEGVPVCQAEYDYRPHGQSRLTISWEVVAAKSFVPESEALQIATLLEQAQGFTGAFDLANLPGLKLLHQNGQWVPSTAPVLAPPPLSVNNGRGNGSGPDPTDASYYPPPPTDRDAPPAPRPFDSEPPEEEIVPCVAFADPVLVNEMKAGRIPDSFEDWEVTKERLRQEALERKQAEDDQAERLKVAHRAIPTMPKAPEAAALRSLDTMIEAAEAEGRLLPTRGEKKQAPRKRLTHGASMDLSDQIVRLLKHTGRPVFATYVARQLNIGYHAAYERLKKLAEAGELECRERKTDQNRTGYEFSLPGKTP